MRRTLGVCVVAIGVVLGCTTPANDRPGASTSASRTAFRAVDDPGRPAIVGPGRRRADADSLADAGSSPTPDPRRRRSSHRHRLRCRRPIHRRPSASSTCRRSSRSRKPIASRPSGANSSGSNPSGRPPIRGWGYMWSCGRMARVWPPRLDDPACTWNRARGLTTVRCLTCSMGLASVNGSVATFVTGRARSWWSATSEIPLPRSASRKTGMHVAISSWSWPSILAPSATERPRRGSATHRRLAANRQISGRC